MLTIAQVATPSDIEDVGELLREYTAWAVTLAADRSEVPTFQGLERELATLPGVYGPPSGRLLLARLDGRPAGCVALRERDAETGELKRLFVRPECRGNDLGRRLVAEAIAEARASGYRRLVLDIHVSMAAAHQIYEEAGFRRAEIPDDFPEDLKAIAIFMETALPAS